MLSKEHEVINKWTESTRVSQQIREVQGKVNFLDKDHVDVLRVDSESNDDNASMDKHHPSISKVLMDRIRVIYRTRTNQLIASVRHDVT